MGCWFWLDQWLGKYFSTPQTRVNDGTTLVSALRQSYFRHQTVKTWPPELFIVTHSFLFQRLVTRKCQVRGARMRRMQLISVLVLIVIESSSCQRPPQQEGRQAFDILGSLNSLRSNILSILGTPFNNNQPRPPPRPPQPGQPPAVLSHTGSSASLMGGAGTNPHHETSSLNDTLDRSGH